MVGGSASNARFFATDYTSPKRFLAANMMRDEKGSPPAREPGSLRQLPAGNLQIYSTRIVTVNRVIMTNQDDGDRQRIT